MRSVEGASHLYNSLSLGLMNFSKTYVRAKVWLDEHGHAHPESWKTTPKAGDLFA